jgi:hypothetical protein
LCQASHGEGSNEIIKEAPRFYGYYGIDSERKLQRDPTG